MKLERYDAKVSRVCADIPFGQSNLAKLIPGYRFDPKWIAPATNGPSRKVWHWPIQSTPVLLRTFPGIASDLPLITRAITRAVSINDARITTMECARALAASFDQIVLPRSPRGDALRAHQVAGIRRALAAGGSRAFFHQTGTGKTITAGTLLSLLTKERDGMRISVVVCPVTLIGAAWIKDLVEWFPGLPFVNLRQFRKGSAREMAVAACVRTHGRCVALINYETVRSDASVRRIMSSSYVVLDESSKIKSDRAGVSETMREIAATFRGCLLLSGTPAPNGNHEYWSQMKVLAPPSGYDPLPGSLHSFHKEFCFPGRFGGFTFDTGKAATLHERLAPVCEWIRKDECLDLPPKSYVDVPIALDSATASAYEEMRDLMKVDMRERYQDGAALQAHAQNALVQVLRLRQVTAGFVPAIPADWIRGDERVVVPLGREKIDWLIEHAESDGERIVLWSQFIFEAMRYMKDLRAAGIACEMITGQTKEADRPEVFRRFINGDFQVLIAHPGVAQYGVSLPGISQAAYGSLSYSLQEYAQSQDRIHGIGRGDANKRSTFYRLIAYAGGDPTIDQVVLDVLDGKRDMLEILFSIDQERRTSGFVPKNIGAKIDAPTSIAP